jgi:RNA polymerase sigma-70 factor (ECF subfamily)
MHAPHEQPPDWPQIAALYGELVRLTGSPVVELNRAAAIAEAGELEVALALTEQLDLDRYLPFHVAQAELLRRLDRADDARGAYDRALELVQSEVERASCSGAAKSSSPSVESLPRSPPKRLG